MSLVDDAIKAYEHERDRYRGETDHGRQLYKEIMEDFRGSSPLIAWFPGVKWEYFDHETKDHRVESVFVRDPETGTIFITRLNGPRTVQLLDQATYISHVVRDIAEIGELLVRWRNRS